MSALCYAFQNEADVERARRTIVDKIDTAHAHSGQKTEMATILLDCILENPPAHGLMVFFPSGTRGDIAATVVDKALGHYQGVRLGFGE